MASASSVEGLERDAIKVRPDFYKIVLRAGQRLALFRAPQMAPYSRKAMKTNIHPEYTSRFNRKRVSGANAPLGWR
ncbi:hypothetical protein EON83_13320 [bacterium]|nr:MAG: hypothetical protein EON83_13320 [bacterium]